MNVFTYICQTAKDRENNEHGPPKLLVTEWTKAKANDNNDDARLTAIFQDNLGKPVPECFHSGFYWS